MEITREQDEVVAKLHQLAAKEASLPLRDLMALMRQEIGCFSLMTSVLI